MKKTWVVVAIVVVAIVAIVLVLKPGGQSGQGTLVAFNMPLTGPIAEFSGRYPSGFTMGVDRACQDLGIPRSSITTDIQDNAGQTNTAVTVMKKQLLGDPKVYVSGTSAMSDAILPEVSRTDCIHFLVSFDAFMTHGNPKVFRILPNFHIEAPLFLKFIKTRAGKASLLLHSQPEGVH
jgi:ABC-type branched-subunit amino acid transport system substrate-binding protein